MNIRRIAIAAVAAIAFSAPLALPASAEVTAEQVEGATTVKQLVALGAAKLTATEFKAKFVGKKLSGDGWTWIIAKNGTTSSSATDGSWKEDGAPWSMKGDQYCVTLEGAVKCRDVYIVGKFMRMSDKDSAKKLSPWVVKLK